MDASGHPLSASAAPLRAPAVTGTRFWEGLSSRCGGALAAALHQWRGTSVLALGESFGDDLSAGKSAQVVQRLRRLNPALRVKSHCGPSFGLLAAGTLARQYGRRSFDAALVFVGNTELTRLEAQSNFTADAEQALADIGRVARQAFLVTAFDVQGGVHLLPESGIAARRRRWLERTLQQMCERHGVGWVPLAEEEGCIAEAEVPSFNFSVDGFRPGQDPHEMWTARMLQQPALAQLVFH